MEKSKLSGLIGVMATAGILNLIVLLGLHSCGTQQQNRQARDLPASLVSRLQKAERLEDIYSPVETIPLSSSDTLFVGDVRYLFVTDDHRFAILDRANHTPLVFDSKGMLLTRLGEYGEGPGEFKGASSICFDEVGRRWYIADNSLRRISVFDASGNYLREFRINSAVKHIRVARNGYLYLYMPGKTRKGMIERVDSHGGRSKSFFVPDIAQRLPFPILGGGFSLMRGGICVMHYASSVASFYDFAGNLRFTYDLNNFDHFVAAGLPSDVRNLAAYMMSFTGIRKVLNGPGDVVIVEYSRAVLRGAAGQNEEQPVKYLGFITADGKELASGILSPVRFSAADNEGNLYSVEYPAANSLLDVPNPVIKKWALKGS